MALFALVSATTSACATVGPLDRGRLATPEMAPRFGDADVSDAYRAKLTESRTAVGVPGSAPGGGCGCSQ